MITGQKMEHNYSSLKSQKKSSFCSIFLFCKQYLDKKKLARKLRNLVFRHLNSVHCLMGFILLKATSFVSSDKLI